MKKLFVLAFAMAMTLTASAQITWNAKLGGGMSMCVGDDVVDFKGKFVGKAGVGLEKPITANFSLMPSLEFAMKGTAFKGISDDTYSLNYIQIPVLGAYRLNLSDGWNFVLKAGPYFAYGISGKYGDYDPFKDFNTKRFDAGVDVGVDFEYHRYVFGMEYERGFVSFNKDSSFDIFNQALYATVGYKF